MVLQLFPKDYKKLILNYATRTMAFNVSDECMSELPSVEFELRFYTVVDNITKYHVYKGCNVIRTNYTRVFLDYKKYHTPTPAEIRIETRIARIDKFLA